MLTERTKHLVPETKNASTGAEQKQFYGIS
jgi:hypothetical protein